MRVKVSLIKEYYLIIEDADTHDAAQRGALHKVKRGKFTGEFPLCVVGSRTLWPEGSEKYKVDEDRSWFEDKELVELITRRARRR